jgi:glycosyltransferase involved in cell wall biosynthesis
MCLVKFGIDGDALQKPLSGVGNYIFLLCKELEVLLPRAKFFIYTRRSREELQLPSERWTVRAESNGLAKKIPSFLWLKSRGKQLCKQDGLTHFWGGRSLHPGLGATVKTIVTIHDLNHLIVPETMQRSTLWSHRLWLERDVKSANVVMCNSHGTASRLKQLLGVSSHIVIRPGVAVDFVPLKAADQLFTDAALASLGIKQPYFLAVGTLEPRKNIAAVFKAFVALKETGEIPNYQLVLVGSRGWKNQVLEKELLDATAQGVIVAGFVPSELMPTLFGAAAALVCPSFYEGFGMPVLEARACGTPTVVTDIPELREAGGPFCLSVKQPNVGNLQQAMLAVTSMQRTNESDLHDTYSWNKGAQELIKLM